MVPISAGTGDVQFLHHRTSWLVPVLGISLVAAVFAYSAGITAARALGAKLASFLGLAEVLFAVLFAWLLLGQLPGRCRSSAARSWSPGSPWCSGTSCAPPRRARPTERSRHRVAQRDRHPGGPREPVQQSHQPP